MEEQIFKMVLTAIACAPVVSGITEAIKRNTQLAGLGVIMCAIFTGVVLFVSIAYVFNYPFAESLLMGFLTGFASIGAFEGIRQTKGE